MKLAQMFPLVFTYLPSGMTTFYTTTTVASTTPIGTELFQCKGDIGYDGLTCKQLETIHGNKYEMCTFYTAECCRTCGENTLYLLIN